MKLPKIKPISCDWSENSRQIFVYRKTTSQYPQIANKTCDTADWNQQLKKIEEALKTTQLPEGPVFLYPHTKITDPAKFVESTLNYVRSHPGNPTYQPYLERLMLFFSIIN
jgi:hypothetical protein